MMTFAFKIRKNGRPIAAFACLCILLAVDAHGANQKNKKRKEKSNHLTQKANSKNRDLKSNKKDSIAIETNHSIDAKFKTVKSNARLDDPGRAKLWADLANFEERNEDLNQTNRANLFSLQADLLLSAGYPLTSAIYATRAIKQSPDALSSNLRPAWITLAQASQKKTMPDLLSDFALDMQRLRTFPPGFEKTWPYYEALAALEKRDLAQAQSLFSEVPNGSKLYNTSQYQLAMMLIDSQKYAAAEQILKSILNDTGSKNSGLTPRDIELANYTKLALGRLYYQQQEFNSAIKFYRAVDRNSPHFYDSLFEQSWAFFMAGYPNHALGSIYSVETPFFKDRFNPEASLLRAIVYYWMCRYEDSRVALADFTKRYADSVESLADFLARKHLSSETAYQLFENFVSGVSSQSLGIPRNVLETASTEDSMMLLREQYAGIVAEQERLNATGVFGRRIVEGPQKVLAAKSKEYRKKIGSQFIIELQDLKQQFDRIYEQSQFLYVELLMSEKEQLLGRELHASNKIDRITQRKNIAGWGDKPQAWGDNRLKEFWWDEVGFYIDSAEPMCQVHRGASH